MSARQRRADKARKALSAEQRQQLRAAAAAAIKQGSGGAVAATLKVAEHTLFLPCSEQSVLEAERIKAERKAAAAAAARQHDRLWDELGDLLVVQDRLSLQSDRIRWRLYGQIKRLQRLPVSNWLSSAAVTHCYRWTVRRIADIAAAAYKAPAKPYRVKQYPTELPLSAAVVRAPNSGYASGMGNFSSGAAAWKYRAGAGRSRVQGGRGSVAVTIRYRDLVAYIAPSTIKAGMDQGFDPAVVAKWTSTADVETAAVVLERTERLDYSLRASGVNTAAGYSHERSGRAYDPRSAVGKVAAAAARLRRNDPERIAAARQAAAAERRKVETDRAAAAAIRQAALAPRLVRE